MTISDIITTLFVISSSNVLFFSIFSWLWSGKRQYIEKTVVLQIMILSLASTVTCAAALGLCLFKYPDWSRLLITVSLGLYGLVIIYCTWHLVAGHLRVQYLRKKDFIKFVRLPVIHRKKAPEKMQYLDSMKTRKEFKIFPFNHLGDEIIEEARKNGLSILISGDHHNYKQKVALEILMEGLRNGETVDYVTTQNHPKKIIDMLLSEAGRCNLSPDLVSRNVVVIDGFSPLYGFSEDILEKGLQYAERNIKVIRASGLAGIHSGVIDAWDTHRTRIKEQFPDGKGFPERRPHRIVYDRASVFSLFTDEDEIVKFMIHVMQSEKYYGMITIFIEDDDAPKAISNRLQALVEIMVRCDRKEANKVRVGACTINLPYQKNYSEDVSV